ncbi:MAG: hypothetical protein ACRCX2_17930 [Paraclostridium sp.]
MLVKNKKIFIDEQHVSVSVPHNTDTKKIVADLIELNFFKYFVKNKMKIVMEDMLYISDKLDSSFLEIPKEYFEEFDKLTKGVSNVDNTLNIPMKNCLEFINEKDIKKYISELKRKPSLIIIGCINNIPESVLRNITYYFDRSKVIFYGDELLSSPETKNCNSHILSNAVYSLVYPYSDFKQSTHKKINSLLFKLRDKKTQCISSIPNNSTNISKLQSSEIDLDYIMEKLELGYNVVVPRRLFNIINSKLFNLFGSSSSLSCKLGDIFYTRFPFITYDENNNAIIIPALSKMSISFSDELVSYKDGKIIYLRNVTFTKPNGVKIDVKNVPIDYSGYLTNFEANEHIDNYEEFEELDLENPYSYDPQTLSILPFRLFTYIEQKYISSADLLLFLETYELDIFVKNKNVWFESISNVLDSLEIIYDTEFDEI